MKLTKPSNQIKNILQSAMGASAYRFLCILMAALLFCGMNSQIMAASVPPGANNDSNNNAPASGDRFNSQSFLKASNPNADDNQHWTWGEEIGAGIVGVALLGGVVAGGYKCYADRNARMEQQKEAAKALRIKSGANDEPNDLVAGGNSSPESVKRGDGMSKATERTIANVTGMDDENDGSNSDAEPTSTWRTKASDALASLGHGAYELVTLKSCWPAAKAAPEKPLLDHLTEVRTAQLKSARADEKAQRSWKAKAYDIFTLKQDTLPSDQTARQTRVQEMARLGKMTSAQLTAQQQLDFYQHMASEVRRKAAVEALNPANSLAEVLNVLDPEMQQAIQEPLQKYAGGNDLKERAFAYFVAKNQDEWHPGHLLALDAAFDAIRTDDAAQEIVQKMDEAIQARWDDDSAALRLQIVSGERNIGANSSLLDLPSLEHADGIQNASLETLSAAVDSKKKGSENLQSKEE